MEYRRFGRTELQMPVFSCGGMRYQYKWQDLSQQDIPLDNQKNLENTIRRSIDLGINHIETARGYGSSEMQLGQLLPKIPREKFILQTKVSPHADSAKFRDTFEKSLKYLGVDYVDLLGIHGINTPESLADSTRPGGCLDQVRKLQEQGKVRFVGFSTHGPCHVIVDTIKTNQFDYVNLHWYWIFQDNWQAIAEANRHDMGVFIISPSDKGGLLYKPSPKLVELCQPLSPMVFNNLFCLSHPEVHTLSLGASKPTDFDEHLKTLNYLDQASEILPTIIERLENEAKRVLGAQWCKTWRQGLPHHENTPDNINMKTILWLRNLALAYDMVEYGKMRYNLLGNGGHWFPGNKAHNASKYNLSECLKNSPNREIIPKLLIETDKLLGGQNVKRLSQS